MAPLRRISTCSEPGGRLGGVRPALDLIEAAAREPKDLRRRPSPPRGPRPAARFRGTAGGSSASSVVARSYFRERSRKVAPVWNAGLDCACERQHDTRTADACRTMTTGPLPRPTPPCRPWSPITEHGPPRRRTPWASRGTPPSGTLRPWRRTTPPMLPAVSAGTQGRMRSRGAFPSAIVRF
jgi:hypothetical protein